MKTIPTMQQRIISAMINFVYFLTNFPKPFEEIIREIWPKMLADHLVTKFNYYMEKRGCKLFAEPSVIVDFILNLDDGNQKLFMEYIETNYHYCRKHEVVNHGETLSNYDAETLVMEMYCRTEKGLFYTRQGGGGSVKANSLCLAAVEKWKNEG